MKMVDHAEQKRIFARRIVARRREDGINADGKTMLRVAFGRFEDEPRRIGRGRSSPWLIGECEDEHRHVAK